MLARCAALQQTFQHAITDRVTVGVVDSLEVIVVQHDQDVQAAFGRAWTSHPRNLALCTKVSVPTPTSHATTSMAGLSDGSNRAIALSLNAWPHRANSFLQRRPWAGQWGRQVLDGGHLYGLLLPSTAAAVSCMRSDQALREVRYLAAMLRHAHQ